MRHVRAVSTLLACVTLPALAHAQGFATSVVSYTPGANANPSYLDPAAALGEPSRFTGVALGFPGAVTPFNPAFDPGQLVSIGGGGSLTLGFAQPITDDPANPFGLDLLIFSNAFFVDTAFPGGVAGALFGSSPQATIEVSADGVTFVPITSAAPVGRFPTLGYLDLAGPYETSPGTALTNFNLPVDPSLNPTGLTFTQLVAAYNGSGGGRGIDLSGSGLSSVSYVRITNATGAAAISIDAVADVIPSPATLALLAPLAFLHARRRRS